MVEVMLCKSWNLGLKKLWNFHLCPFEMACHWRSLGWKIKRREGPSCLSYSCLRPAPSVPMGWMLLHEWAQVKSAEEPTTQPTESWQTIIHCCLFFFFLYFYCWHYCRCSHKPGVSNSFLPGGHISLAVAFKGPNVILGLYKCNYSLTVKWELGAATR